MMNLLKYLIQYRPRDMAELIKNENTPPLPCNVTMAGKTVVISGSTSGIGLAAAHRFASYGASLIFLNRNEEKSRLLETELQQLYRCTVKTLIVDFSSMAQTKECARQLLSVQEPIDAFILNSGVYHTKKQYSSDGIEIVFQVNHLSSFCLLYMLKEKIKEENRARIIYVNSEGHRFALAGVHLNDLDWKYHCYTGLKSYGAAKTAQLLTMLKFAQYFESSAVTVNAMHPGNVRSHIGENNGKLYNWMKTNVVLSSAKDTSISAQALHYLCASPELTGVSGKFFNLTTKEKPAPHASDISQVDRVWNKSLELCGLQHIII